MSHEDAYTQAWRLADKGPTVILNLPTLLRIRHTPLHQLCPSDQRHCSHVNEGMRLEFMVCYAVEVGRR